MDRAAAEMFSDLIAAGKKKTTNLTCWTAAGLIRAWPTISCWQRDALINRSRADATGRRD